MIICSRQGKDRIYESRFLQAKKDGIGAQFGSESAVAQFIVRFSRSFVPRGIADFSFFFAATFKDAQHVARLGDFPAIQGIELGNHAFCPRLLERWGGNRLQTLRLAVAAIALSKSCVLVGNASVVVECRAP